MLILLLTLAIVLTASAVVVIAAMLASAFDPAMDWTGADINSQPIARAVAVALIIGSVGAWIAFGLKWAGVW